jgi:uncharacterized membrane protein YiaA
MKLLTSASKIVFLAVTATVCTAFLFGIFTGKINLDSKDFFALALMVFTFYFANKGETGTATSSETTTTTTGTVPPYAGK